MRQYPHFLPWEASNASHFYQYMAGLWEGDGHADRKYQTYIAFTFHRKNKSLVHFVQLHVGGSLRYKKEQNAYVLTLRKKHSLAHFLMHMQNTLRTPKYHDLQAFPFPYAYKATNQGLFTNGWLAGFIDADGDFKIRFTQQKKDVFTNKTLTSFRGKQAMLRTRFCGAQRGKRSTKRRIALSFALEQRKTHPLTGESFEPIMQQIAKGFDIRLRESRHNDKLYWCIELSGRKKLQRLVAYLETFPLLSCKRHDFEDWKKAYALVCAGKHVQEEGRAIIWKIKQLSSMNIKILRKTGQGSYILVQVRFLTIIGKVNIAGTQREG